VRLMGRCILWAGASYGPVRLMGRCVLWAGASYGPENMVIKKNNNKQRSQIKTSLMHPFAQVQSKCSILYELQIQATAYKMKSTKSVFNTQKISMFYRLLVCCYVLHQMVTNILQQGLATCSLHYQHVQTTDVLCQSKNYYSRNN